MPAALLAAALALPIGGPGHNSMTLSQSLLDAMGASAECTGTAEAAPVGMCFQASVTMLSMDVGIKVHDESNIDIRGTVAGMSVGCAASYTWDPDGTVHLTSQQCALPDVGIHYCPDQSAINVNYSGMTVSATQQKCEE